jgi:hypothetical protein
MILVADNYYLDGEILYGLQQGIIVPAGFSRAENVIAVRFVPFWVDDIGVKWEKVEALLWKPQADL